MTWDGSASTGHFAGYSRKRQRKAAKDPVFGVFLYSEYSTQRFFLLCCTSSGNGPRAHFLFLEIMGSVPTHLQDMAEGVVGPLGFELWGLELLQAQTGGQLLRVYIEKSGGIGVADCEKVSRQLSAVLDVEDPISGEYTLEVSSPGMNRPLFNLDQLSRYLDENIRVKLKSVVPGRKNYRGKLLGISGDEFQLLVDNETVTLAFSQVESAHLVANF